MSIDFYLFIWCRVSASESAVVRELLDITAAVWGGCFTLSGQISYTSHACYFCNCLPWVL